MEKDQETKKKKSKYNYKKIALAAIILIIAVIVIFKLLSSLISLIMGHSISSEAKITGTDAASDYDYCRYGDGILYANSQSVKFYDDNGEYLSDVLFSAHNPYVETMGDYAVLCDMNSSKLSLLHERKDLKEFELKQPVVFAKVNKKGDVAAVTSEKGYKSSVYIYDKNGNEKYIWHSGSGYVIDCAVSDKGNKFVVLSLVSEAGKLNSAVTWFETDKEQPAGQVIIEDCFAYQLIYKGNNAYVISNNGLYKADISQVVKSVDFEGRTLLAFDTDYDGNIVTSQKTSNSGSVIIKYNSKLKEKFRKELDFEAECISCNDKKIAVSGQDNMAILTSGGRVYAKGSMVGNVSDILLSEKGDKIYSFSDDKIKIYSVKLGR
ncbi:MAG: hypothetical protein J6A69_09430 [Clostridia bacterium]|nr:hypothetical protein [Clostridia bacterium]